MGRIGRTHQNQERKNSNMTIRDNYSTSFSNLYKRIHEPKRKERKLRSMMKEINSILKRKWWLETQDGTVIENDEYKTLIQRLYEIKEEAETLR